MRLTALVLSAPLMFGPLAASQVQPARLSADSTCESRDSDGTIELWHAQHGSAMARVLEEFRSEYASTHRSQVSERVFDSEDHLITELAANGTTADVVLASERAIRRFHDLDLFASPQRCDPTAGGDLLDLVRATYTFDGELVSVPFGVSTQVLVFDAAKVRAAGLDPANPPRTIHELMAASRAVRDSGAAAHGLVITDWCADLVTAQFAARRGDLQIVPDNGRQPGPSHVELLNEGNVEDFDVLRRGVADGHVRFLGGNQSGFDDLLQLVNETDSSAMTIHTSGALGDVIDLLEADQFPGVEMGVGPLPSAGTGASIGGNSLWLVDQGADELSRAWTFVAFASDAEHLARLAAATGYVPPTRQAAAHAITRESWARHPQLRVAYAQVVGSPVTNATAGAVMGPVADRDEALFAGCTRIMRGDRSVLQGLSEMTTTVNQLVALYERRPVPIPREATSEDIALTVSCSSTEAVVGAWVDAAESTPGWATLSGPSDRPFATFRLDRGGPYRLTVGCGGSPEEWKTVVSSRLLRATRGSLGCVDVGDEAARRCDGP